LKAARRSLLKPLLLGVACTLTQLSAPVSDAQQRTGPATVAAEHLTGWQDTFTSRLEALALLQTLNADLLSHDSATLTLERWCSDHRMAAPPQVVADQEPQIRKEPTALQRQELQVTASEPVRYRRVQLRCGEHVLSVADNWYVPGRLTADMNHRLQTTDTPFGRVVLPLHFLRRTLGAALLWSPLPAGWESGHPGAPSPWPTAQAEVLRHRALLVLPDGRPISEVVESYTAEVLAFPQPRSP
jgi:chorismate-pyruvate lyase